MSAPGPGDKSMNATVTTVLLVVLGIFLVFFGLQLVTTSAAILGSDDGPLLAAIGLGAVGTVMIVLPILVTTSQIRSFLRSRRNSGRG